MDTTDIFAKRKMELEKRRSQTVAQPQPITENLPRPEIKAESQNADFETQQHTYDTKGGGGIIKILYPIIGVAAVAVAAYYAFMTTTLHAKEVENEARFQCAQSSRYQVENETNIIWYPAAELYNKCLQEKGVN